MPRPTTESCSRLTSSSPASPSIFFDAVAVIVSEAGARGLAREAAAVDFVSDAFNHLKVIGHVPAAEPLLRRAGIIDELTDAGLVRLDRSRCNYGLYRRRQEDARVGARAEGTQSSVICAVVLLGPGLAADLLDQGVDSR